MPDAHRLHTLFNPQSIAVLGASAKQHKVGGIVLSNLSTFTGKVYPINLKEKSINGFTVFSDIGELPEVVDLLLICIPVGSVYAEIEKAAQLGVRNFVIYSAGYGELGEVGKKLENELNKLIEKYNLNVLGPNCFGFLNTTLGLNTTFGIASEKKGGLKVLTQSGALAASLFDYAQKVDLGFDEFITLGNKLAITELEVMEYWSRSKDGVIGMYLESITQGREFYNRLKALCQNNTVFILKPGKSESAKNAMSSHTGSLAGDDVLVDVAIREAGAIRCHDLEEFFVFAKGFSWLKKVSGNRVGVLSNAGGPAVVTTDLLSEFGLELAVLSESTKKAMQEFLPSGASTANPVDVLGDALAERYKLALEVLQGDEGVDNLLILLTPQSITEVEKSAEIFAEFGRKSVRPVVCVFMGGSQAGLGEEILNKNKIPNFNFPNQAVKLLAAASHKNKSTPRLTTSLINISPNIENTFGTAISTIGGGEILNFDSPILPYSEVEKVLSVNNIKYLPLIEIESGDYANLETTVPLPVVMKIVSTGLLHKTDKSAVITDIYTSADFHEAYGKLTAIIKDLKLPSAQICIQHQVKGVELIVGVKKDESYGHVLMVGFGGVTTELFKDNVMCLLPASQDKILSMLASLKTYKLLNGYRNLPQINLDRLSALIYTFSQIPLKYPQIKEMEINPLIVTAEESWAVDVRILT